MAIRELVRGTVGWVQLEAVAREVAERTGRESVRVEFVEADNWLSVPCIVDDEFFVKVITRRNAVVHSLFTAGRNLGVATSGRPGFFERAGTPLEMAEHELEATRKMQSAGIDAPDPVDAFEVAGVGVLVLEYLPAFRPLGDLSTAELSAVADDLFERLGRLHENGLVHGDLRAENVLLCDGELYFIDATTVDEGAADTDRRGYAEAEAYDLACALAMLAPRLGARDAVEAALDHYDPGALLAAGEFMDFVSLRPDHGFDAAEVKGEVEKIAS
jgi:hypothetical protein